MTVPAAPKVALVEVFKTVQGEGYHAGRASVFVRLAGCPLACAFADGSVCDTPYMEARFKLTVEELFEKILYEFWDWRGQMLAHHKGHSLRSVPMLVVTGGEPTASPQFDALVDYANACGFYTAVETNGTTWKPRLLEVDWITLSPKDHIPQGSPAPGHNPHPQVAMTHRKVEAELGRRRLWTDGRGGEYRYVIGSRNAMVPTYHPALRHYVSPAALSDGSGAELAKGFDGFVPGALERCLEIVQADPRWTLSVQVHKMLRQR